MLFLRFDAQFSGNLFQHVNFIKQLYQLPQERWSIIDRIDSSLVVLYRYQAYIDKADCRSSLEGDNQEEKSDSCSSSLYWPLEYVRMAIGQMTVFFQGQLIA